MKKRNTLEEEIKKRNTLEDTFQAIADEAVSQAERVDCSFFEFVEGLGDIAAALKDRYIFAKDELQIQRDAAKDELQIQRDAS